MIDYKEVKSDLIDLELRRRSFLPTRKNNKIRTNRIIKQAIAAIDKQIPKPPVVIIDSEGKLYKNRIYCSCGRDITDCKKYCDNCGQKIREGSDEFYELLAQF